MSIKRSNMRLTAAIAFMLMSGALRGDLSLLYWPATLEYKGGQLAPEKDTGLWGAEINTSGDKAFFSLHGLGGMYDIGTEDDMLRLEGALKFGRWIPVPMFNSPHLLGIGIGYGGGGSKWDVQSTRTYRIGRRTYTATEEVSEHVFMHGPFIGLQGETWLSHWFTELLMESQLEDFDFGLVYEYWFSPLQMDATSDSIEIEDSNGTRHTFVVGGSIKIVTTLRFDVLYRASSTSGMDAWDEEINGPMFRLSFVF